MVDSQGDDSLVVVAPVGDIQEDDSPEADSLAGGDAAADGIRAADNPVDDCWAADLRAGLKDDQSAHLHRDAHLGRDDHLSQHQEVFVRGDHLHRDDHLHREVFVRGDPDLAQVVSRLLAWKVVVDFEESRQRHCPVGLMVESKADSNLESR
ncbi:hypothetical protein [Roseiconus lacunae]|uniref:Uncharacterized protein n=1 Tax=Roseiconus lacunae TaxID=2605694 RepID=A0ABT7PG68_9BACT|nr:hypothetical protein [Roseiconus lacunae]MDM4015211.1 hypothetical protein [Roseiconus lacunae]